MIVGKIELLHPCLEIEIEYKYLLEKGKDFELALLHTSTVLGMNK